MAQLIGLNIYQINQQDPIPLASVGKYDFPFSGMFVRPINNPATGLPGFTLSTGVTVYSQIQLFATNTQYSVIETPAAIAALS